VIAGLSPSLVAVLDEALEVYDMTLLDGLRTPERQAELVRTGASKTLQSKHLPGSDGLARAVDLAPYLPGIGALVGDAAQVARFGEAYIHKQYAYLAGVIVGIGAARGVKIRWGGDWDGDRDTRDQTFHDLGHFEEL